MQMMYVAFFGPLKKYLNNDSKQTFKAIRCAPVAI